MNDMNENLKKIQEITQRMGYFDALYRAGRITSVEYDAVKELYDICYDTLMQLEKTYKQEK